MYSLIFKKLYSFLKRSFYHPLFNIAFVIVSFITVFLALFAFLFANNLYENILKDSLSNKFLFIFFFILPLIVICIILILIIRIWTYRFLHVEGSKIRTRIMMFFIYLGTTILVVFLFLAHFATTKLFDFYEFNYLTPTKDNVQTSNIELEILYRQTKIKEELLNMVRKNKIIIDESKLIDFIITYDINKKPFFTAKKNYILNLPSSLDFPFLDLIPEGDFFSSYLEEEGLLYTVHRKKIPFENEHYIVGFHYPHFNLIDNISKTQRLQANISSFQILKGPLKISIYISIFYIYFVLFAVGIIYFYYKANAFTLPIILLNKAAKSITQNNFNIEFPKKKHEDEVFELILSFQTMVRNLKDNRFKLKRLSQIEAWKEVIERISHELKNPLTPINLAVDQIKDTIIKKDFETYFELNEKFNLIQKEIDRIRKLLKEINFFNHVPILQKISVDIKEFISQFSSILNTYSSIKYKIIFENEIQILYIDKEKIYQVILNILQNAVEALQDSKNTKQIKTITLKIYDKRLKISEFTDESKEEKEYLYIEISNNGPMITPKEKENIFKPYITYKSKGTGLGLSICEQIVYAHQGRIHLESVKEKTTFTIDLPIVKIDKLNKIKNAKN